MNLKAYFTRFFLYGFGYREEEYRQILALEENDFLNQEEIGVIEKKEFYTNKDVFRYLEEYDEKRFRKLLRESRINMVLRTLVTVISIALYISGILNFLMGAFLNLIALIGGASLAYYGSDWEEPFRAMMANGVGKVLLASALYVGYFLFYRKYMKQHAPFRDSMTCFQFGSNGLVYSILLIIVSVVLFFGILMADSIKSDRQANEAQIADLQAGILNAGNLHLVFSEEDLKKTSLTIPYTVVIKDQTYHIDRVELYTFHNIGSFDEVTYEEGIRYIDSDPGYEFQSNVKLILPSTVEHLGEQFFRELGDNSVLVTILDGERYSCRVKNFLKEYNRLGTKDDYVSMNVKKSAYEKFDNTVFRNLMINASK